MKFDLVQNAFNQFPVKSFLHDFFQRLKNQLFNFRDVFVLHVAQARAKHQLLQIRFNAGYRRHILTKFRVNQRLAQGAGRAAYQQAGKNFQKKGCFKIFIFRKHPCQVDSGSVCDGFALIHRVRAGNMSWRGEKRLAFDRRVNLHAIKTVQHFLQELQMIGGGNIAVQKKAGIGRRVILPVKIPELFIRKFRNHVRVAPGIQGIDGIRVQVFLDVFVHQ